jgi:hypothetical protein
MVKYINDIGLHPFLCKVLSHDEYDTSDDLTVISATSLMQPTRMIALSRYYSGSDKEIKISGLIPSVFGTALHSLLEVSLNDGNKEVWKDFGVDPKQLEILQENRVIKQVPGTKWKVSGKYDLLYRYKDSQWRLGDLKTQSVWGVMLSGKEKTEEYIKQLSIYRWLNQDKDIDDIAEIFYWFTDWSKQEARRNSQYPQQRLDSKEIILWSIEDTEKYIKEQLKKLDIALNELLEIGDCFIRCTNKELWRTEDKYKYYKPNKSGTINYRRATKVCDTLEDAQILMSENGGGDIVKYPGEIKRCNYCSVTEFCSQFKEYKQIGLIKD